MENIIKNLSIDIDCPPAMFYFILNGLSESEKIKKVIQGIRQEEFESNSRGWSELKESTIKTKKSVEKNNGLRYSPDTVNVRSGKLMDEMEDVFISKSGDSLYIGNMAELDQEGIEKIMAADRLGRSVDGFTPTEIELIKETIKEEIIRIVKDYSNA